LFFNLLLLFLGPPAFGRRYATGLAGLLGPSALCASVWPDGHPFASLGHWRPSPALILPTTLESIFVMDQLILVLESSSRKTSVALIKNGHCWLVEESSLDTGDPAAELTLFVQKILQRAKCKGTDLAAIALSKGPGSYTGLRIAYSTAKGLAFAWQRPLLALDTLAALAYGAKWNQSLPKNSLLICLEDARRGNAYAAIYNSQLEVIKSPFFVSLKELDLTIYQQEHRLYVLGSAAMNYQEMMSQNKIEIDLLPIKAPSARFFEQLAQNAYEKQAFAELAYSEPFYLRAPHLTKPKKNKFFSKQ